MKKRFELFEEELQYWIHDHETKKNFGNWDLDCLTDLLNEQDENIKELESELVKLNRENDFIRILYKQSKQSQNQKAIECLEKVLIFVDGYENYYPDPYQIKILIEHQLSELRGINNVKKT